MKNPFNFPMKKSERILGLICIPVHAALIPAATALLCVLFLPDISPPYQTLICYTASFVLVVCFMFRFLKTSFSDLIDGFWRSIQAIILGYAFYFAILWVAGFLLGRIMSEVNPNTELYYDQAAVNPGVMTVIAAVLAPIVEETLFRGALFGTIRQKSRILAYIVSALVFAIYHLWPALAADFSLMTLLYALQYLPASIALAWCYERGGTIWAPIVLHSAMNLIAASLSMR